MRLFKFRPSFFSSLMCICLEVHFKFRAFWFDLGVLVLRVRSFALSVSSVMCLCCCGGGILIHRD